MEIEKKCKNCKYCQVFYVKNDGVFFRTFYGYCRLEATTVNTKDNCSKWEVEDGEEKFAPITETDIKHVIRDLQKLIETLGISSESVKEGICKERTIETAYNAKLE